MRSVILLMIMRSNSVKFAVFLFPYQTDVIVDQFIDPVFKI